MGNYVFEIQKNTFAAAAWLKQGEHNRKFKMMTFTKNGDIKQKPDKKYVNIVGNYFPGTIISANEWKQFK